MELKSRARGSLLGLASGDALGAPTEGMTREAIAERWGRVDGFLDPDAAGTDDTEYAVLCARGALRHGRALTSDDVADLWLEALSVQDRGFAGAGFSEMVALDNLRRGIRPPDSGERNDESWSDGAAMRAAPLGLLCPGDPVEAARLASVDAAVSHARDGVFAAEAVAAAVATAAGGGDWRESLAAGREAIPADSWTRRTVDRALLLVAEADSVAAAETGLAERIPLLHYPWADAAPEALALAFGLVAAHEGRLVDTVLAGVNIGRDSDTIAAMAGAICGAIHGEEAIPPLWRDTVRSVSGRCITATAGTDLIDLADALAEAGSLR
ncbi:ADP-ribosylglycohydrolase family protein [Rathayibacter oskolensis]|uniref:ADP-ribosylglycohydrolase family protein n=1 Tax=Rathayibacter oskolensis TaxID=1891671 RepID=UPI00265FAEA7|nr:ADP-ribosylglycohydrolase family protein [Rathayibacter oskolensis]WKK70715.1 ADP-ribosylglycohydrolase family protein [Rathayibacter oskolensis]